MRITTAIRHTRNRSTDDITDREDERALGFGKLDGCQCIGCFSGLGDSNHHIVFVNDRSAIAELRGVLYFNRYLRELFDGIHSDKAGMPGGTTSRYNDSLGIEEAIFVINETGEGDIILTHVDTSAHGVRQRTGLLEDLLEHEMGIAAFLELRKG